MDLNGDYVIHGINLQGRADDEIGWVTKFKVSYFAGDQDEETDSRFVDNGKLYEVPEDFYITAFSNEIFSLEFDAPVFGRFVTIHPMEWIGDDIALRVGVNLCSNWLARKKTKLTLKVEV